MILRRIVLQGVAIVLLTATAPRSFAQEFPDRPIKIVVPTVPGGGLDIMARLLAQAASGPLNQSVYVENRPGANWIIGMESVAKSAPDGYTLLFVASSGLTVNPHFFPMPLEPLRDLTPVTIATDTEYVLLANPSVPAHSIKELVHYLRSSNGKIFHASNSVTTMLTSELFKSQAKVEYVDINYKGAEAAVQATIAGETQLCFVALGSGTAAMNAGTLRPLGTTGSVRSKVRPNIPTLAEQGLDGFSISSLVLLLAPTKVPLARLERLNAAFRQALASPEVNARLVSMGQVVVGSTPKEALNALLPEAEQFRKLINERNIKFSP
jgi:tripartite-type tricarboxylate transporter receptor subunit TctC